MSAASAEASPSSSTEEAAAASDSTAPSDTDTDAASAPRPPSTTPELAGSGASNDELAGNGQQTSAEEEGAGSADPAVTTTTTTTTTTRSAAEHASDADSSPSDSAEAGRGAPAKSISNDYTKDGDTSDADPVAPIDFSTGGAAAVPASDQTPRTTAEDTEQSEAERMASYFKEDGGASGGSDVNVEDDDDDKSDEQKAAASTPLPADNEDEKDASSEEQDEQREQEQTAEKDPTQSAAQHMAAVAAAALASSQGQTSPSAAADYAKQLMPGVVPSHGAPPPPAGAGAGAGSGSGSGATIVAIPGSAVGPGAIGPTRVAIPPLRAVVKVPVSVDHVRDILKAEAGGDTVDDANASDDAANKEVAATDAQNDGAEANESDGKKKTDDSDGAKGHTVVREKLSSDPALDCFLRHLLLLSDVMPEPKKDQARPAALADGGDNEKKDATDNDSKSGGNEEKRKKREAEAAKGVVKTLYHAEAAYNDLLAMLPSALVENTTADTAVDSSQQDENNSDKSVDASADVVAAAESADSVHDKDGDEAASDGDSAKLDDSLDNSLGSFDGELNDDDEDDTVYDYGESSAAARKIVPDLLPPCISTGGDATSAFFRSCRGPSPEDEHHDATTSGPTTMANDTSSISSSASSITASTAASSAAQSSTTGTGGGGRGSFVGLLSSVKTRAGGGKKAASPKNETNGSEKGGMFGRRRKKTQQPVADSSTGDQSHQSQTPPLASQAEEDPKQTGRDYTVQIDREMLGLTVENVLERTVVRTVLPGGAAKRAGAKVGSLIVKVGSVETANLTHFETIDELRQSQRPLKLVLRLIGEDALRGAREEMGRLIRGGGFGMAATEIGKGGDSNSQDDNAAGGSGDAGASSQGGDGERKTVQLSPDAVKFASSLHTIWHEATRRNCRNQQGCMPTKRDEAISEAGEKLVWILTLLVIGLEREAVRLEEKEKAAAAEASSSNIALPDGDNASVSTASSSASSSRHKHSHHTAKDYAEAARSVSKQLLDYVNRHFEEEKPPPPAAQGNTAAGPGAGLPGGVMQNPRRKRQPPPPPHVPIAKQLANKKAGGAQGGAIASATNFFDRSLHSIGDVLHRTMTFLADPTSPPAALIRGEVISFLCDILDIDTEMRLADEESASSVAGGNAAPINELGSAGSLLKLIVLNCSMMRSPGCVDLPKSDSEADEIKLADDIYGDVPPTPHRAHAGNRFLAVVHRLAASRSTSARVTACSLGPVLWAHLDFPHQLQLRGVITRALHDVEVIVRKSTATVLHEIAELVFDPRSVPWLVLMCERAMTDPEPQLRAAAMTLTWHLAEHLPNAFLGDARKGSRALRRLPSRTDPLFAEVYLLQCKLLPVATRLAEDRSPAVRLAVAAQCDRLCNALGDHWFSVIIDLLQALLGDTDERVRGEAMLCMPRLVDSVLSGTLNSATSSAATNVLDSLLPLAMKLLKDPSANVRVSLATACGELLTLLVGLTSQEEIFQPPPSPTGGSNTTGLESLPESEFLADLRQQKKHIDETLIPLVQRLLHDTDPEVTSAALRAVTNASRGNVREISSKRISGRAHSMSVDDDTMSISSQFSYASMERKEPVFIPVLSENQVLRLLPTLSDLSENPQWRVRQSAVEIVPALLGCTHKLETRSEIAKLCIELMDDEVDAVRRTAAECLCLGGGSLARHGEDDGGQWISAIVIPQLRKCSESQNCKQRMLSLKMVEVILLNSMCPSTKSKARTVITDADGKEAAVPPLRAILDIAGSLSEDRVVNVRLNVGRVFASIAHHPVLEEDELNFIVDIVEKQLKTEEAKEKGGDRDVVYFAKQAISVVKSRTEDLSLSQDDASLSLASTTTSN